MKLPETKVANEAITSVVFYKTDQSEEDDEETICAKEKRSKSAQVEKYCSEKAQGKLHLKNATVSQFFRMTEARVQIELAELLERILREDEAAFSDFYERTINRVYGLVFKVLGDQDDSEEVVSDVYAQVWQQVDKYHSDKGSVIGWLLMMARCRAIDFYRKRKSAQQIKDEVELFLDESTLHTDESELLLHMSKSHELLNSQLNELSHIQKQLLSLSFFKGLSHSEIAAATNMPPGTVKSHIRRALIVLQSVIKE